MQWCDELEELLKHESETAVSFAAAVAHGGNASRATWCI
jgi:hypothetical protein